MKKSLVNRIIVVLSFALASVCTGIARPAMTASVKDSTAAHKQDTPAGIHKIAGNGGATTRTANNEATVKKIQKIQKSIETGRKIAAQKIAADTMLAARADLERRSSARRMLRAEKNDRVNILGMSTAFIRAPSPVSYRQTSSAKRVSLASPVLMNGKQSDTINVGEPCYLTFSFATGFVSAVMRIYLDADSNGVVSNGDLKLCSDDVLLLDNDDMDADPSEGGYKIRVDNYSSVNHFVGTLIFEVNDYQSTATALLTVKQSPRQSVVKGTFVPAIPNIVVNLYDGRTSTFVYTDSAGTFIANVGLSYPNNLDIYLQEVNGACNDYMLPARQSISISGDTTSVRFELTASKAFVEGYVKDYDGNPAAGIDVRAEDVSLKFAPVLCRTDSTGHYHLGLAGGTWTLLIKPGDRSALMQGQEQSVLVPSSGSVRLDMAVPNANSTISGKVVLNSKGIGGFPVYAVTSPYYYATYYNSVLSGADGNYSIPVSNSCDYDVGLVFSNSGYYADENVLCSNKPGSSDVDFTIRRVSGGIAGVVTDSTSHDPIANAVVEVMNYSTSTYSYQITDDGGYYRLPLADGWYEVQASAKGHFPYSNYVTVSGKVVTWNISMLPSGSISGKVTDINGTPISSAQVTVYDAQYAYMSSNYSDFDGTYYVDGLNAGQYKVVVTGGGYISQWYNQKPDFYSATTVSVSQGKETSGINFSLVKGGIISGIISDKDGQPIVDATIVVYDSMYYWMTSAVSNDSGRYAAGGLNTGKYYVYADAPDFAAMWYDGKKDFNSADKVPATVGLETPNVNFKLMRSASFSGRITDKYSYAIPYGYVYVFDTLFNFINSSYGDYSGAYKASGLGPGSYRAMAQASGYAASWYDSVISLSVGEAKRGVDFVLSAGGSITGRVLDESGNPISLATVTALQTDNSGGNAASTDPYGNYTIGGLLYDKYLVYASAAQHIDQWYNHETSSDNADTIRVHSDSISANINFDLAIASGLYGTVVDDSDSYGLDRMTVSAFDLNSRNQYSTNSQWDGSFYLNLPAGNYMIEVFDPAPSPAYLPYFYTSSGCAALPSKSQAIRIYSGQPQTRIDIRLKKSSHTSSLTESNLKITVTNTGTLGDRTPSTPSCRWPSNSSRNYLFEGDLIIAGVHDGSAPFVFGGMYGNSMCGLNWNPVWNFSITEDSKAQSIRTAFTGNCAGYGQAPELTVEQTCYSNSNTDYAILTYKIRYDGVSYGSSFRLSDLYVGQFLDFDVSPYKDLVGKFASDTMIFVYDSTNPGGVNIGARLLSGLPARIGWWKAGSDPLSDTAIYLAMKSDTSTSVLSAAGDQRVMISSGPYTIDAGDSLIFTVALVAGNGADAALAASKDAVKEWATAVNEKYNANAILPGRFELRQNYPNPFNPSTAISFDLPKRTNVKICIYNILGQLVETLVEGERPAGQYSVIWNAGKAASGVYFCRMESKSFTKTTKMLLMK